MTPPPTEEDLRLAREWWREHGERFNELIWDNVSNADYEAETERVRALNEAAIIALAAFRAKFRREAIPCGCPVPDCQHHRGLAPWPTLADRLRSEREACERIVEEEFRSARPECRVCVKPWGLASHRDSCPVGRLVRRLRERAK